LSNTDVLGIGFLKIIFTALECHKRVKVFVDFQRKCHLCLIDDNLDTNDWFPGIFIVENIATNIENFILFNVSA